MEKTWKRKTNREGTDKVIFQIDHKLLQIEHNTNFPKNMSYAKIFKISDPSMTDQCRLCSFRCARNESSCCQVERIKNYGDLENVAAKHHKVLIKKEAVKLQQIEQQRETQLQQQQAIKQQYYQNVNNVLQEKIKAKEFDGIPINPKLAGELQDFLVTDKYKTNSGETLTDFDRTILELKRPENHATKVKLALIMKIMEKDPTLSTIQKTGITKKSNELFGEVARQAQKSSVKSKPSTKSTSWFQ